MKYKWVLIAFCMILFLSGAYELKQSLYMKETFSQNTIRYGAAGADVRELQGRLKFLGYYHGAIDGDFGTNTLKSVKWFQSEFGMHTDGVAGPQTKLKLWNATRSWRPGEPASETAKAASTNIGASNHQGLSENDIKLMANAIHGEARGEPYIGQVAVAAVILNRVKSPQFPNTVSGVIFQPGAFTAVSDGQIWLTPDSTSRRAALDAIGGNDPTGGSIYYFNPETATSKWIWGRPQVKTIGKHIFCR